VADAAADNLRKENRELKAKVAELNVENDNLKSDCNDWKDTADDRVVDVQNLTAERDNLKADITTQKEVNEDLKTKIADLRNRVGEQLAQIQDLNAEVHFLKEKGGKPTEEATKHAHVVLNDGTELAFTQKDTIAFYRDDVDMLFISDGNGVIAGFNRGDKPFNFAYFY
jgi:chromosome segregation ATPase